MSLFPPTKTPAPLPGSAVLPKEKGRFIFACFTPVSVPVLAQGFLQHTHQHGGVLFLFADLVRHQRHQPPLLGVQFDGVVHAAVHHLGVEGAVHIVRSAHLVGPAHDRLNNEKGISHIFIAVL